MEKFELGKNAASLANDALWSGGLSQDHKCVVPSGLFDIDKIVGGWQKGDLIILGSRPAVGKTALATKFALEAAKAGSKVAFFSLEMPAAQLFIRIIAAESGVDYLKLRKNNLTPREQYRMDHAIRSVGALGSRFMIEEGSISVRDLATTCEKLKQAQGLELVVVDYLQLMKSEGESCDFGDIAKELKAMAAALELPVMLLSQITKTPEEAVAKSIVEVADVVLRIHRIENIDSGSTPGTNTEIVVEKNRKGPLGSVKTHFDANTLSFSDMES